MGITGRENLEVDTIKTFTYEEKTLNLTLQLVKSKKKYISIFKK